MFDCAVEGTLTRTGQEMHAPEALADGRGHGPLEADAVTKDGVERLLGHEGVGARVHHCADVVLLPLDGNGGGLEHLEENEMKWTWVVRICGGR